jgi:hypothetical protein
MDARYPAAEIGIDAYNVRQGESSQNPFALEWV